MNELAFFSSQPRNTKLLIGTSFLYALVLPVVEIFTGAYIMHNTFDASRVVVYQLCVYAGIPFTFLLNGYLLNHVRPSVLYAAGMLLSGVAMLIMTSLDSLSNTGVGIAGLLMGASFGFYWSNRDYLVLVSTNDGNRNYYYGLDTFANTVGFVIVPLLVGWFIELYAKDVAAHLAQAYHIVIWICMFITVIASYVVLRGDFASPLKQKFLYFKFHSLWNTMAGMAVLKGMVQGFIVTAPSILVMKLVGKEGALGTVQSVSACVTAVLMYIIGRTTKPKHRLLVMAFSLALFIAGALINTIMFNALSVLIFLLCLIVARPLFDFSYFPVQLRLIDFLSIKESRNEFAYILNHEFWLFIGRAFGCGLFIFFAFNYSDEMALKYTLPIVTILQGGVYFLAKRLTKSLDLLENK